MSAAHEFLQSTLWAETWEFIDFQSGSRIFFFLFTCFIYFLHSFLDPFLSFYVLIRRHLLFVGAAIYFCTLAGSSLFGRQPPSATTSTEVSHTHAHTKYHTDTITIERCLVAFKMWKVAWESSRSSAVAGAFEEQSNESLGFSFSICHHHSRHQASTSLCRVGRLCFLPLYFLLSPLEIFSNP